MIHDLIEQFKDLFSNPVWAGISAIAAIIALIPTLWAGYRALRGFVVAISGSGDVGNPGATLQAVDAKVTKELKQSLDEAPRIGLAMEYQTGIHMNARPLEEKRPIDSVFDEDKSKKILFILGAPGSGKTIMLLELAQVLIQREDPNKPSCIPVVVNLSSWAAQRLPLAEWLMKEIHAQYGVSREVAKAWIDHDQILPLLDGLDEVRQDVRGDCVDAINDYYKNHKVVGMVVCSRTDDYEALPPRLRGRLEILQKTRILVFIV